MKISLPIFILTAIIAPISVFAADAPKDFSSFVGMIVGLIELLILALFAVTFIVVMWGIIDGWVINGGDPAGVEKGKKVVTAGIIGLVVMSALWGIVYMVKSTLFGV